MKPKRHARTAGSILCLLALALSSCRDRAESGDKILLRLSHITAPDSSWDRGASRFAELVDKASDGKIVVKVFSGGRLALGNQETELQMLRDGSIDMTLDSPIILALYLDKRFDAFSLPWLFHDHPQAMAVCDGPFGRQALGWLEKHGIVGLAWGVNGFRQLTNSRRPVLTPADMNGLKVRVAGSDIFLETFRHLGAQPLTMNFGELLTALEQGVVDAQENPLSIIESSRLYECQKHVTLWDYTYDPIILTINAKRWQSLSADRQATIRQCAKQAMDYQRKLVIEDDRAIPDRLTKQGMTVTRLTPAQREAFEAKTQGVYTAFRPRIGPAVVDQIVQAAKAATSAGTKTSTAPTKPQAVSGKE
ncbi:MAG: DctP family TRAP transporter solute-binding subunit [Phycisphaerae bacterium]|nr:DctP family TRAP transporter solute-binding subunit [Phycisphaerae bacterium]